MRNIKQWLMAICHRANRPNYQFMRSNRYVFPLALLLTATAVYSGGGGNNPGSNVLFPVRYSETVFTDTSRTRSGFAPSNPDNVNGPRLIDVRVYQPAKSAGSGPPIRISVIPKVFNGTYANQPLIVSDRRFPLSRSWSNNVAKPGTFPVVLMFGGADGSYSTLIQAETIAAAGYIVIVPTGYGTDPRACPSCPDVLAINPRTLLRDGRIALTAAENGQLGFNSNQIKKDSNGITIAGCVGGSQGATACIQTAAGTVTTSANSIPNESAPDPRIKAVFAGDLYVFPSPGFNEENFTAAIAMYASGIFTNWTRDFDIYHNASKRIFYDLYTANHGLAYLAGEVNCPNISEWIRVTRDGLLNNGDDLPISASSVSTAFESCSPQYLKGVENLFAGRDDFSTTFPALVPKAPLGVSSNPNNGIFNLMTNYYTINFLNATLKNDPVASLLATIPIFPGILDNIYVNKVPGTVANNFNLQNLQIDFKPISGTKRYKTTITNRSGPIPDPSLSGAYSLFGTDDWEDDIGPVITPAFGSFPILNGNITKSNSISVSSNGFISPESNTGRLGGLMAANRLKGWFGDHGSWTIACLGTDLVGGTFGPNGEGQIWVSNTPQRLQITWYQVGSYEFPNEPGVNAQCTLFPDGSIRLEYDESIPSPGILTGEAQVAGSMVIGITNSRLHVQDGFYNFLKKPTIRTLTDVMNGKSTKDADAIFEIYTQEVPAQ